MDMDKLVSLCKRRGFMFQSSEIYGGLNGFWDYGPLGVELKRNIKEAWWRDMVTGHDELADAARRPATYEMVGLDCTIIMHPQVWKCSGHYDLFHDMMVDCRIEGCKGRFRVPITFQSAECPLKPSKHPGEFEKCQLTEPREFNLMFKTIVGALGGEEDAAFLRPETAQGIFVNFKNVLDSTRVKIPFGIAQMGKSFRNEITPRNFTFRSREFEQMEIEFFCHPSQSREWYEYWRDRRMKWYTDLGLAGERLRLREHEQDELSHYSCGTADIEYAFPFLPPGEFGELEGIAHRGDFDLRSHMEGKLVRRREPLQRGAGRRRQAEAQGQRQGPDVSRRRDERAVHAARDRAVGRRRSRPRWRFLCEAYHEDQAPDDKGDMQTRVVMKFHPRIAPVKAAVFPLVKKDGMPEVGQGDLPRAEEAVRTCSTTRRARSAAAIAARTKPARRTASRSTARRCRTRRSRSAIAIRWSSGA